MFAKNKKRDEDTEELEEPVKNQKKAKPKSDKTIKPRAPRSSVPKIFLRTIFWAIVVIIFIRGISSFFRTPQTIQEINITGNTTPTISDSIKGFATDFATEYFTWSMIGANDRILRLSNFISEIDQDAGLKSSQITGESKVLSTEIYDSKQIDDTHFEITTLVRREVTQKTSNDATDTSASVSLNTASSEGDQKVIYQKTYMIIPVTLTQEGPLIQQYPRFDIEQKKGISTQEVSDELITDNNLNQRATELTDSFLRTYLEGNVSQLKYFYLNDRSAPSVLTKSDFSLNKVLQVQTYKVIDNSNESYLRINAVILVTNEIGESFTNQWVLNVVEQDEKMYVTSIGYPDFDGYEKLLEESTNIEATSNQSSQNKN